MVYQKSEIFFHLITIALVVLQRSVVEVVGWGGYKYKKGPPRRMDLSYIRKYLLLLLQCCVSCCKACDRHTVWRAAYVVQASVVAELN